MPATKTERLVNLVICLLATRTFVPKERLRATLEPYRACSSDEAFERMFERDKEELRQLGIPLEVGAVNAYFEDEIGYRIAPGEYALPELELEPDEAAALGLAARFWQQATLAQAASSALLKLKAAGVEIGDPSPAGIEPRVRAEAPAFEPLLEAVYERQIVRFPYRRGDGQSAVREVEPWTIDSWRGRWYLAGFDVGRGDARVFRLDRITGPVLLTGRAPSHKAPARLDVRAQVEAYAAGSSSEPSQVATLLARPGTCFQLRRMASEVTAGPEGWDTLTVAFGNEASGWLAEFGADLVVLEPPGLRRNVIARLRAQVPQEAGPSAAPAAPGRAPEAGQGKISDKSSNACSGPVNQASVSVPAVTVPGPRTESVPAGSASPEAPRREPVAAVAAAAAAPGPETDRPSADGADVVEVAA
ncbi:MAG TPA: WYL domain-containing protein [Actinocrinis sp.]|nr:WYL domain-containing protein [Actinocrinis sp.]